MLAKNAFKDEPSSKPIRLTMNFCLTMPKKPKHKIHPIVRPDLDNYQKAVCDSLNGIIYVDDSQVVEIMSRKYYSKPPVEPFIDILAEEFI